MNDFSDLFERFVRISPSDLSREDAERLAQLIQSDSRLCLQLPQSFNHQRDRSQFARALNRSWVEEEYAEVLDYRRKLLRSAAQHRRQRAPIIALLLYATWIEHTINVVIIGSGRLNSLSAGSVDDMARRIVATDFTSRVTKMW